MPPPDTAPAPPLIEQDGVRVWRIVSVPFDENTYVFAADGRDDAVVFDPGLQPAAIASTLDAAGLTPAAILCTHGHADHIAGNAALKQRWPDARLLIGEGDEPKLSDPVGNLSAMSGLDFTSPPADATLRGGEAYEAAGLAFEVRDTPGHSAGHVSFVLRAGGNTHVVAGDVLFNRGVGRTDFPDGDAATLVRSIHQELFPLPDASIVYPGHGPTTTIGEERRENPFVGAVAGYPELATRG